MTNLIGRYGEVPLAVNSAEAFAAPGADRVSSMLLVANAESTERLLVFRAVDRELVLQGRNRAESDTRTVAAVGVAD